MTNDCGHTSCKACVRTHIRSLWHEPSKYPICCFEDKCHDQLSIENVIKQVLNKNQFKHFETLSKNIHKKIQHIQLQNQNKNKKQRRRPSINKRNKIKHQKPELSELVSNQNQKSTNVD